MIVTLYSTKSSTKTSIAVSTAVYLINQDKNTVFVDLDILQGSAVNWLDIRQEHNDLIRVPCIQKSGKFVARELLELKKYYEWLIVDCAGQADVNGRSALTVTDLAIIPVMPSSLSLMTLENTLNVCIDAQAQNEKLKVALFLTCCSTNYLVKETNEAKEIIKNLIDKIDNFYLADSVITYRKAWMDIVNEGKGISESTNQQASQEFNQLMQEIFTWHSTNQKN
ncbi:MAG: AAA family ATPase [Methylococcales bacterium]